jgi:hypothetical protein
MNKLLLIPLLLASVGQAGDDWHDKQVGEKRIQEIRARLKAATPCPWKSDGDIAEWWNGEQPGVMVRSAANFRCYQWDGERKYCFASSDGGPVAEVSSAYWSGSHDPISDADFIAHSCEDIEFLLKRAQP